MLLGMQTIAKAGRSILIVTGEQKQAIARRFISSPVTEALPATFLKTLPGSVVFFDRKAAESLGSQEDIRLFSGMTPGYKANNKI